MRTRYQLTFVNIIDKHVAQALVLNQKYARYVPKNSEHIFDSTQAPVAVHV